jgi:hypothetical protein
MEMYLIFGPKSILLKLKEFLEVKSLLNVLRITMMVKIYFRKS